MNPNTRTSQSPSLQPPQSTPRILNLLTLPTELHLSILTHLPWRSLTSLRLTHPTFLSLLPSSALKQKHTRLTTLLHNSELTLHHQNLQTQYALTQLVFSGELPSYFLTQSYAGDPDIHAQSTHYSCSSDVLPCYSCLRWLPSSTRRDRWAAESQFSRTRSIGSFDLAGTRAKERICIECGIRQGIYGKGTQVKKSIVCVGCGSLGEPVKGLSDTGVTRKGVKSGEEWWRLWWCERCWTGCDGKEGAWMGSKQQWEHMRLTRRYDEAMRRGKEYRVEKGRRLREERGILQPVGRNDTVAGGGKVESETSDIAAFDDGRSSGARYCPIMDDRRFCFLYGKRIHCCAGLKVL